MTTIELKTQQIRNLLDPIVGETRAKTYFSYYGIFKDGAMFGLYKDGIFYLHIPQKYLNEALQQQDIILLQDKSKGIHNKSFYQIPSRILTNLAQYRHWIDESINEIRHKQQIEKQEKKLSLRSQTNFDIGLERLLRRVNVFTVEEMQRRGAIDIFVELVERGYDVGKTTLLRLHGATLHRLSYSFSEQEQQIILEKADQALYDIGLRKRLTVK